MELIGTVSANLVQKVALKVANYAERLRLLEQCPQIVHKSAALKVVAFVNVCYICLHFATA